jgi:hypothetical protein
VWYQVRLNCCFVLVVALKSHFETDSAVELRWRRLGLVGMVEVVGFGRSIIAGVVELHFHCSFEAIMFAFFAGIVEELVVILNKD